MIIKLYTSVLKCAKSGCTETPTIVLDSYNNRKNYTAGQTVVCEGHYSYGKESLAKRFPGREFQIRMDRKPSWLLREQREARELLEKEIPSVSAPVQEGKPKQSAREDLIAQMLGMINDSGRRK